MSAAADYPIQILGAANEPAREQHEAMCSEIDDLRRRLRELTQRALFAASNAAFDRAGDDLTRQRAASMRHHPSVQRPPLPGVF